MSPEPHPITSLPGEPIHAGMALIEDRAIVFTCTEHVLTAEGAEGRRGFQKAHPLRSSACSAVHLNTYDRASLNEALLEVARGAAG